MMPPLKNLVFYYQGEKLLSLSKEKVKAEEPEFLLSALCALTNNNNIYGLAADTDGKDGLRIMLVSF